MPIPEALADRAGALLVMAARTGQELATRRLAPMGLTVRLCGVLILLGEGPVSQQALGEQLGIDRTTMVELIDELERKGVVVRRRNAADRRSYALSLTARGRAFQKQAVKAFDDAADEFFGALKPAERHELSSMLRRLISAAGSRPSNGREPKVPLTDRQQRKSSA